MKNRGTILVVDDDRDITANVIDILSDIGYSADGACDACRALEMAKSARYDLILIDYKMPGMDGATLFTKIKSIQPEVVAIMVTAHAGSEGVKRALAAGTWRVLSKPIDVPRLLTLIGQVLDCAP